MHLTLGRALDNIPDRNEDQPRRTPKFYAVSFTEIKMNRHSIFPQLKGLPRKIYSVLSSKS
jgi:hypothetical protein